jgi:hypothetical protein
MDIGQVFGGRDHTTVMHACTRISDRMQQKQEIYNYVMELTVRLKQSNTNWHNASERRKTALFGLTFRKVPFLVAQADSGGYVEATDSRH